MIEFIRVLIGRLLSPLPLVCWVSCSLIATAAGPFGTYESQFMIERLFYWSLIVGLSIFIAYGVRIWISTTWPKISLVQSEAWATVGFTAFYAPVVWAFAIWWAGLPDGLETSFLTIAGFVFLVGAAIVAVPVLIVPSAKEEDDANPPANDLVSPTIPRLLLRLPEEERAEIYAICSRDHYVDILTALGKSTLLIRFADAIAEADRLDGLRVHRSHWVVRKAVVGSEFRKGQVTLILVNGAQVPVSRSYRDAVEKAGIITPVLASE